MYHDTDTGNVRYIAHYDYRNIAHYDYRISHSTINDKSSLSLKQFVLYDRSKAVGVLQVPGKITRAHQFEEKAAFVQLFSWRIKNCEWAAFVQLFSWRIKNCEWKACSLCRVEMKRDNKVTSLSKCHPFYLGTRVIP